MVFSMATITAFAKPDWPIDTGIQSEAGIVMDMDSGAVLFAQNIHEQKIPASITKLMTALLVAEAIEAGQFTMDTVVTVPDNAFEGLFRLDANHTPQPALAENYTVSEDGLTYTFHLREGLKWSDGTPLTAHDFVYSWQRAVDPATGADYAYMFECIAGYTEAINGEEYVAPAADASSASTSESAAESVSASTSESASASAAA